ncbi:unnamed protein product, partial [marine sediment metagenome]
HHGAISGISAEMGYLRSGMNRVESQVNRIGDLLMTGRESIPIEKPGGG